MRVLVAGAGKVGRYLALDLVLRGHDVVVVERDRRRAASVQERGVTAFAGDACAPEVLERAGLRDVDVLVAATGDDEDNLVISLLGKEEFAVPRVIARVNHPTNEWLFDDTWGVDRPLSPPHLLTAFVEEEVTDGDIVPLLALQQGTLDLVEVRLDGRSRAVGARLADLELPSDAVVVAILRQGRAVAARATLGLEQGDEVLAITPRARHEALRAVLVG